ncbi:MAG: peptidoglycan-binding protein [Sphingomonadaceae bacterium]|nr:peptidoglycan-binding protein [Sphingomonadaceae bacterium]
MPDISASVGNGGVNNKADVAIVQHLLNAQVRALGLAVLDEDGKIGDNTSKAIARYQQLVLGIANPDGRIDVGGGTWKALAAGRTIAAPPPPAAPSPAPAPAPAPAAPGTQLSGAAWWHANQANYPNSAKLADLASPFREKAMRFVDALRAAGAQVEVSATLRNPIRAHLMHYSWEVAHGTTAPGAVPAIAGCTIRWDHGDLASSKQGAQEMVDLFGIVYEPALTSLHIRGEAVDMNIGWSGTLNIADANGVKHAIGAPRSGESNRDLHAVGATYGVKKLLSDAPHWSSTGH